MTVHNRYVRSATASGTCDKDTGYPTERYYKFYERIAKSCPGIIINEITTIDKDRGYSNFLVIDTDESIPYHKRFNDLVK